MENDAPDTDPLIGKILSERYRVLERIGRGGYGEVYKVQHIRLDKIFALKILFRHTNQNPRMIKRFEREARATCRIGHENIVGITDFARDSRVGYYFVMEHLVGETLGSRLQKLGPMPSPQIIHVACQIADALAATHAKGIVHRDLKPDNVFLVRKRDENSFVKILDFGIVGMADMDDAQPRLARHEAMRGTPAYMSPEQAEGQNPDHRSDIYSLGIMLYELATGQVPYRNAAALAVLEMHRSSEPTPPREARPDLEILPALERIILRALRKSPAQRYQSMREVYNDMVNLSQQIDMRGVMGRLPEHRVDGPPTPAPEDIETEEPEWLDEDLVLLDDGADTNDDLAPIGPTQPMASALDNAPTLMDQPRVPTQDQLEPAAGHSLTAEASVQPSETSAARPSPAVADSPESVTTDRFRSPKKRPLWHRPPVLVAGGFLATALLIGGATLVSNWLNTNAEPTTGSETSSDTPSSEDLSLDPAAVPTVSETADMNQPGPVPRALSPHAVATSESPETGPAGGLNNEVGDEEEDTTAEPTHHAVDSGPLEEAAEGEPEATDAGRRLSDEEVARPTAELDLEVVPAVSIEARQADTSARQERDHIETESSTIQLVLNSQPPGATVLQDSERLGQTPLTLTLNRDDGPVELLFRHRGYRTRRKTIELDTSKEVMIRLRQRTNQAAPRTGGGVYESL